MDFFIKTIKLKQIKDRCFIEYLSKNLTLLRTLKNKKILFFNPIAQMYFLKKIFNFA